MLTVGVCDRDVSTKLSGWLSLGLKEDMMKFRRDFDNNLYYWITTAPV